MFTRRLVATAASLALAASIATIAPAMAGDSPIKLPASPKGLKSPADQPSGLDPASPYLPQTSCSPHDQVGAVKLRDLVLKTYGQGGKGNISRGCTEGVSEHAEGRAWDWMISPKSSAQKAAAADFLSWITKDKGANARRLGIMYVIYDEKIWAIYRQQDGWRKSSGHQDHVHISLSWNGARGTTSFWTGKLATTDYGPCSVFTGTPALLSQPARTGSCPATAALVNKTSRPQRVYGTKGSDVTAAQRMLGVKQSGVFDGPTWTAVKAFQVAHDLPRNGVLDQPTWAALSPGDVTSRATKGYSRDEAIDHGLAEKAVQKTGAAGLEVAITQIALGLDTDQVNGYYGAGTKAAVESLQKASDLTVDGVMGRAEWQALDAARG